MLNVVNPFLKILLFICKIGLEFRVIKILVDLYHSCLRFGEG